MQTKNILELYLESNIYMRTLISILYPDLVGDLYENDEDEIKELRFEYDDFFSPESGAGNIVSQTLVRGISRGEDNTYRRVFSAMGERNNELAGGMAAMIDIIQKMDKDSDLLKRIGNWIGFKNIYQCDLCNKYILDVFNYNCILICEECRWDVTTIRKIKT